MKKFYIMILSILYLLLSACSGKSIEERAFTYYDTTYGKFYLEVDDIHVDDINDVITLTMKYTASQAHSFILDTFDDGKAGMMYAELRLDDMIFYSTDDLPHEQAGGEVQFEINEKVFRTIQFSPSPFHEDSELRVLNNGDYIIWLYVDKEFMVETDIIVRVNI